MSDRVVTRAYEEKVYAGVLGKLIGVYLGRPFEQWSNDRIERELGEIRHYVHETLKMPLIVTDDDITGTFTFFRALSENGCDPELSPAQIGDWWLNTIIENRTILWWGGFGLSTEHTAFLRLKSGMQAPRSGSIAENGVAVAEEIGAQIFIDGWGLICPGDPAQAVEWARRAASVSHDGEAIYGAQIVAALVALAFVETDLPKMLGIAAGLVPQESIIWQLIQDVTRWAGENGDDWRATLRRIHETYPYARFGTNCPMVSNHAIVLMALLHGNGDFSRSLMIANTAGYDTDCNSGNVGCILGVLHGLEGLEGGTDWRGPVGDRMYLPTADGGRAITDALSEAYEIVNTARCLRGHAKIFPKDGARFHFSLPGSTQGWQGDGLNVRNEGSRLALRFSEPTGRAGVATFIPPDAISGSNYDFLASPRLYSGQVVRAALAAPALPEPVTAAVYLKIYSTGQESRIVRGPAQRLASDTITEIQFTVPDTGGQPVHEVGLELTHEALRTAVPQDAVHLDSLTWDGMPTVDFRQPEANGEMWKRAWVSGADTFTTDWVSSGWTYRMIQNEGVGLVTQGEATWQDYEVSAHLLPHVTARVGLVAAGRGLRRYVALVLDQDDRVRLIRRHDGHETVLAERAISWKYERPMQLTLSVSDQGIRATVDGHQLTAASDGLPLNGAIGFIVEQGNAEWKDVRIAPLGPNEPS